MSIQFQKLVERSRDLFALIDEEGTLLYYNHAVKVTLGYPTQDYIGRSVLDLAHPDDLAPAIDFVNSLIAEPDKAKSINIRIHHMDGTYRWLEVTGTNLLHDPDVNAILLNGRDITERRRAEESEHEQHRFAEAMRDSLATLTSSRNVDEVLQRILVYAGKVIPSDGGSIVLFDADKLRVAHLRGFPPEAEAFFKDYRFTLEKASYSKLFLEKQPYFIADTRNIPGWKSLPGSDWIRSSMGIPIEVHGSVVGALIADSAVPDFFRQSDVEKLLAFARYAGLALENAYHVTLLEEKVAERTAELTDAKERLEAILNNSIDAIVLTDPDLHIRQSNVAFAALFACEPGEYLHQSMLDFLHPDDRDQALKTVQAVIERRVGKRIELRARRKSGSVFEAELSIGCVKADGNIPEGLVCTIRNISQRKEQERQLRYHASLQENISDAVVVTDMDYRIQSWSRAAETIYGWSAEEVIGKTVFEVMGAVFADDASRQLALRNLMEQGFWNGELVQRRKDGGEIYISASINLLRNEDGQPYGIAAIVRDITVRKQAEEALRRKHEQDQEFQQHLKALHEITIELALIDDLDEFWKRTVELGRERFGFERLALFLYDSRNGIATGTYGTDETGQINDERHIRFTPMPDGIIMQALRRNDRIFIKNDVELYTGLDVIGTGWNAAAVLWNGRESLGWLVADNNLYHKPATQPLLDILSLYGLAVGALLARKMTDAALRESESRYRLLAENISDVIILTNRDGELLYVSPSIRTVLGYDPDELLGHSGYEYIHPDDISLLQHTAATVLNPSGSAQSSVYRFRHKEGHYVWMEARGQIIISETTGEIDGFIVSNRNITERKRAEEALRESEARYRLLAENVTDVVVCLNADGDYVYISPSSAAVSGYSAEDLYGKNRLDFIHPDDLAVVNEMHRSAFETAGPIKPFEYRFHHRNGYYIWLEATGRAIYSEATGQVEGFIYSARDIGERKRAERTIRENEERLRILFDSVPDAITLLTLDGTYVDANPASLQMSKYPREEIIGKNVFDTPLFAPEDIERAREGLEQTRRGERGMFEFKLTRADGTTFTVEVLTHPVTIQGQRLHLSIARDITARKQAEESLRKTLQTEKELGELKSRFVSIASHEFRTPLASIMSSSEILLNYRDRMDESRVSEKLQAIVDQVKYLTGIINDVLDLSRLQSGRIEFKPALLALDEICREIVHEFQNHAKTVQELVYTCNQSPLVLHLDRNLMRQVISNLLSNAIKYSPDAKAIFINLERRKNCAVLSVRDQGIGIPEADLHRLFEPFHRAANVGTISGTGLGLSIVEQAVVLHGGTISVDSEVGAGSTFRIALPYTDETPTDA